MINEGEAESCHCAPRWTIEGYDTTTNSPFCYVSRHVVLATGSTDLHNFLRVPGELSHPAWVFHDLAAFEQAVKQFVDDNPGIKEGRQTVSNITVFISFTMKSDQKTGFISKNNLPYPNNN